MSNGSVIGLTKVVDNGPGSRQYNPSFSPRARRRASYRISPDMSNFCRGTAGDTVIWSELGRHQRLSHRRRLTDSGAADRTASGARALPGNVLRRLVL